MLALMAASGEDAHTNDGESYIEKYTRGVSAVESILMLDRLRQASLIFLLMDLYSLSVYVSRGWGRGLVSFSPLQNELLLYFKD